MRMQFRVIRLWQAVVWMIMILLLPMIACFWLGRASVSDAQKTAPAVAVMSLSTASVISATPTLAVPTASPNRGDVQMRRLDLDSAPTPSEAPAASFDVRVITRAPAVGATKRVLIYHSHTYEAYEATTQYTYTRTEEWRTADAERNVVRVGTELSALLTAMGYEVTHDTGEYEPPNLSGAYTRSLDMLQRRIDNGEQYDLYLDLHRDAYVEGMSGGNAVHVGGTSLARIALLIGKGTGLTGTQYADKPNWQHNLAIAESVTQSLNQQVSGMCRPVIIKTGRFNQHVADCCVLIEVGNNRNTLEEALAAMPYLAVAIANYLR